MVGSNFLLLLTVLPCTFFLDSKCAKVALEYVPGNRIPGCRVLFRFTRQKQIVSQFILLPGTFKIPFQSTLSLIIS